MPFPLSGRLAGRLRPSSSSFSSVTPSGARAQFGVASEFDGPRSLGLLVGSRARSSVFGPPRGIFIGVRGRARIRSASSGYCEASFVETHTVSSAHELRAYSSKSLTFVASAYVEGTGIPRGSILPAWIRSTAWPSSYSWKSLRFATDLHS